MKLLSGSASTALAEGVADALGISLTATDVERFPDGEVGITIDPDLRGEDLYLVQSTGPPVDAHMMELLLLADAARRCGAAQLTAVIPYLGYARQDRRRRPGEPISIRVVGDLLATQGIGRVLVVDPHTPDLEAIFSTPVESATAVPAMVQRLRQDLPDRPVVVSPDLGATGLAQRYADELDCPVALVRKTRLSGDEVRSDQVIGDVEGRHAVIVDDMISTGGTLVAAVEALIEAGSQPEVTVAATHGVFVDGGKQLADLPLRRLLVSDSLAPGQTSLDIEEVSLAPLLADAIRRLEANRRLDELETFH